MFSIHLEFICIFLKTLICRFKASAFAGAFFCLVELYRKRLNEKQVSLSRYSIYQTKKFLRAFL